MLPIVGDLITAGLKIIDKVIPDPAAKAEAQLKLMQLTQNGELAQLQADLQMAQGQVEIDKIEAASPSFFKSGWRPAIGWVCGVALATQFLIAPLGTWVAELRGYHVTFPTLDMSTLMTLLFAMLGVGTMRTTEKIKGVA
jgi:hypothetical protein